MMNDVNGPQNSWTGPYTVTQASSHGDMRILPSGFDILEQLTLRQRGGVGAILPKPM